MSDDARHQISKLIFTCDQRNDDGDFDGVGELFAHATIGVEGMGDVVCEGAQGTAEQFRLTTDAPAVTATFTGPLESAVRLLGGRLTPKYTPEGVEVSGNVTLDELRAVFPGF